MCDYKYSIEEQEEFTIVKLEKKVKEIEIIEEENEQDCSFDDGETAAESVYDT